MRQLVVAPLALDGACSSRVSRSRVRRLGLGGLVALRCVGAERSFQFELVVRRRRSRTADSHFATTKPRSAPRARRTLGHSAAHDERRPTYAHSPTSSDRAAPIGKCPSPSRTLVAATTGRVEVHVSGSSSNSAVRPLRSFVPAVRGWCGLRRCHRRAAPVRRPLRATVAPNQRRHHRLARGPAGSDGQGQAERGNGKEEQTNMRH